MNLCVYRMRRYLGGARARGSKTILGSRGYHSDTNMAIYTHVSNNYTHIGSGVSS